MSNRDNKDREGWLRGDPPDDPRDDFARAAARGREELGDEADARALMAELDQRFAAKFPDATVGGSAANPLAINHQQGAAAGASEGGKKQGKPSATVRPLRRLFAIAAAVLLLLLAGTWWMTRPRAFDAEALFATTFEPYANDLSGRTMGDDDSTLLPNDQLAAALLAYDRQDYADAVRQFEVYYGASSTSPAPATAPKARLYYGISQLGANQPVAAAKTLGGLRADPVVGQAATWYFALANLRYGGREAARLALEEIAAAPNSPFRARAQQLLLNIPAQR